MVRNSILHNGHCPIWKPDLFYTENSAYISLMFVFTCDEISDVDYFLSNE